MAFLHANVDVIIFLSKILSWKTLLRKHGKILITLYAFGIIKNELDSEKKYFKYIIKHSQGSYEASSTISYDGFYCFP